MTYDDGVARAFVQLTAALGAGDPPRLLQALADQLVRVMGAEAAGVVVADRTEGLRVAAVTDDRARVLDELQLRLGDGPLVAAAREGAQLLHTFGPVERRWPQVSAVALQQGLRSVCATPLRTREDVVGAVDVWGGRASGFGTAAAAVTHALADLAALGLLHDRSLRESRSRADQLQVALNSRVVIEQAKGMLAEHGGVTMDQAFAALRGQARRQNRRIADLARDVVEGRTGLDPLLVTKS